jgi:hypothetical protein
MGTNQYPKTITNATDILSNHNLEDYKVPYKKKVWSNTNKYAAETQANKNPNDSEEMNFAQINKDEMCYCCGKKGHISPKCKEKNTRNQEDWAFRRAE